MVLDERILRQIERDVQRPQSTRLDPRAGPLASIYFPSNPNQSFELQRSSSYTNSIPPPPPYYNSKDPEYVIPSYGTDEEVPTMARSLFYYGFSEYISQMLASSMLITC